MMIAQSLLDIAVDSICPALQSYSYAMERQRCDAISANRWRMEGSEG